MPWGGGEGGGGPPPPRPPATPPGGVAGGDAVAVAVGGDDPRLPSPRVKLARVARWGAELCDPGFPGGDCGVGQGRRASLDELTPLVERLTRLGTHRPAYLREQPGD